MGPYAPGIAKEDLNTALRLVNDPFTAGGNNNDFYKGKVVLLVDTHTISMSEFIGMCIQAAPDCTTLGEQTAGVVANTTRFTLPDGESIVFTGFQASYPDGTVAYRNGLKIDVPLNQSALRYDPTLIYKKAVEIISQ